MILLLLQQVAETVTDSTAALVASGTEPETVLGYLIRGGLVMVPIGILSIATIALFVERIVTLRRAAADPVTIMDRIRDYVRVSDIEGAKSYCDVQDKPITRILRHGLDRLGRPIADIQDAVNSAGKHEAYELEKRIDLLASFAGIAPMLGFLGTVTGMIRAFQQIQNLQGNVNPSVLAGGIWEALLSTAAGLSVGIIAYFFYNFLLARIGRRVNDMERSATEFIDMLQTPSPARRGV